MFYKSIGVLLFGATTFIIGLCVGALEYRSVIDRVKFTEFLMVLVPFLGVYIAVETYSEWLNKKKREDAYLTAKKYIGSLHECRDILRQITELYGEMCPAPGVMYEPPDSPLTTSRVERCHIEKEHLYRAYWRVKDYQEEFRFWNISLESDSHKKHVDLLQCLRNIDVVTSVLNNQLPKSNDSKEIIATKNQFDELTNKFERLIKELFDKGFDGLIGI